MRRTNLDSLILVDVLEYTLTWYVMSILIRTQIWLYYLFREMEVIEHKKISTTLTHFKNEKESCILPLFQQ